MNAHGVLRTCFVWEGVDEPVQVVKPDLALIIDSRDWRGFEDREQVEMLEQYLIEDRSKGFDLGVAPLLRLALIRANANCHEFVFTSHHLLMDGWSLSLLLKDFFSAYESLCGGASVSLEDRRPYSDYIAWLGKQDPESGREYWRRLLEGFTQPASLSPLAAENGGRNEGAYDYQEVLLNEDTSLAIKAFARAHKLTLGTLGQGVWGLLLSLYCETNDVVFGAVTSGRSTGLDGIESMIGLFINTLPVRLRVAADTPLVEWLSALQAQHAAIREYEYCALSRVQSWSDAPAGTPLFESLFVFENYPLDAALAGSSKQRAGRLFIENIRSIERSNYPLTIWLTPGDRLLIRMGYDRERFGKQTIEQLIEGYAMLLDSILANHEQRVEDMFALPIIRRSAISRDRFDAGEKTEADDWPGSAVEKVIARLWGRLLERERVGREDNFFECGGRPVLAARLLHLLRESLRVEVPLTEFSKTPTAAGLSRLAVDYEPAPGVVERIAGIVNRIEEMPEEDMRRTLDAKAARDDGLSCSKQA